MKSQLPQKDVNDDRMVLLLPSTLKQKIFEQAAEQQVAASHLVRRAVSAMLDGKVAA